MIAVFRDQHMRQKSRTGNAARDRTARRFRLYDALTAAASEFRSNLTDHFEARRHVLQHFRYVFAEMFQFAAAVRASSLFRRILSYVTRQMLRQRPPRGFRRRV